MHLNLLALGFVEVPVVQAPELRMHEMKKCKRLIFLLAMPLAALSACERPALPDGAPRVLVLGMDGLDPVLLKRLMDEGRLPNFKKLADKGTFLPLETAMPPQSPVAWSNFIAGATPGTHQIWDFVHRDPNPSGDAAIMPVLSTSRAQEIEPPFYSRLLPKNVDWNDWRVPLAVTHEPQSLRRGAAFWESLVAAGVDTTLYRLPATYPPPKVEGHGEFVCLCGMGTPDMLGGYGASTCFSEDPALRAGRFSGEAQRLVRLTFDADVARATLEGPLNHLKKTAAGQTDPPPMTLELEFVRDVASDTLKIVLPDQPPLLLKAGEWSPWQRLTFQTGFPASWFWGVAGIPTSVSATANFYVRSVRPPTHVYMSPMQIDPEHPVNPVSAPAAFAKGLARQHGLFHTEGIPEATKALDTGALTEAEFRTMVQGLLRDRLPQYRAALAEFKSGLLFYYFGHTDQLAHVFWQDLVHNGPHADAVPEAYEDVDARLGEALASLREGDVIIVMSDHGFAEFRRGFNVNNWLRDNGYQQWHGDTAQFRNAVFNNIVFEKSRAYAIGINGLYVNERGREKKGIVAPEQRQALLDEISAKLLEVRDENGAQVIVRVYDVRKEYPGADPNVAPDLLLGYARDYRGSWATGLGGMSRGQIEDNRKFWRGDHCIAHTLVPGVLLTNLKVQVSDPKLMDLAPSILNLFGAPVPREMIGRTIFAPLDQSPPAVVLGENERAGVLARSREE